MQQRENSGVLFKNDQKQQDNHPDYRGEINVGGKTFWLSAWIKQGNKGKFMSLALKPRDDNARSDPGPRRERREYDGDAPF